MEPSRIVLPSLLVALACSARDEPPSATPSAVAAPTDPPAAATEPSPTTDAPAARDPRIPAGSADYSIALADSARYKRGEITFEQLRDRVLARKLPPHPLGDDYLLMIPPAPPPPAKFDPLLMPSDWAGTWGEIAMTMFAGDLTRAEYDRLHRAAHPQCP